MKRQELLKIAKPILFSTPMVQAIQDDRKTSTRRVIKFPEGMTGRLPFSGARDYIYYPGGIKRIRYKVGDILYARETWSFLPCLDCYERCGGMSGDFYKSDRGCYVYRADYGTTEDDTFPPSSFKWKPSIHMPKEAARIFLKVTDVRIERLQDIAIKDIEKEGYPHEIDFYNMPIAMQGVMFEWFANLWSLTIKKKDLDKYAWNANPWVGVVEFKKLEVE